MYIPLTESFIVFAANRIIPKLQLGRSLFIRSVTTVGTTMLITNLTKTVFATVVR